MSSTLSVNIQGLGLSRQVEDDTIEACAEVRSGDVHALGVRQRAKGIAREESAEELKGSVGADRCNAGAVLIDVIGRERRGGHVRRRDVALSEYVTGWRREGQRHGGRAGKRGCAGIFEVF
jgi:hypothetical protein